MRSQRPVRPALLAIAASAIALAASSRAPAQSTELVSISDGKPDFATYGNDVSRDGRFVAYAAYSSTGTRVEVRDLLTATTTVVTPYTSDASLLETAISANGKWIAFRSGDALTTDDSNVVADVYIVSSTGTGLELLSVPDGPLGGSGVADGASHTPRMTYSGDIVAFESLATNLVSGSIGPAPNVFLRDRSTGTTLLVNTDASGVPANAPCYEPFPSSDGQYVAFWSNADNLVPGDTNGHYDVFVKNMTTGAIALVSRDGAGAITWGTSQHGSLSADGRFVVFVSDSTWLFGVAGSFRVYRHDRDPDANGIYDEGNGVTELVSWSVSGGDPQQNCYSPRISDDGQRIAFFGSCNTDQGLQQNRASFPGVYGLECFVFDMTNRSMTNVLIDSHGNHADGGCYVPYDSGRFLSLSGDGLMVVYGSYADYLDPAYVDGRSMPDTFAHEIARNVTQYLGYDKRGGNGFFPEFTVSGGLATGETAEFRVRRAPPSTIGIVLAGLFSNPTPGLGGTLVPLPALIIVPVPTDANGSFTATMNGGGGPLDLYVQWAFLDPLVAPRPFAITNTLKVTIDP